MTDARLVSVVTTLSRGDIGCSCDNVSRHAIGCLRTRENDVLKYFYGLTIGYA